MGPSVRSTFLYLLSFSSIVTAGMTGTFAYLAIAKQDIFMALLTVFMLWNLICTLGALFKTWSNF